MTPRRNHVDDVTGLKIIQNRDIRTPARPDQATITQAKNTGRGMRCGAISMMDRAITGFEVADQAFDQAIKVAFFADIKRVAVIGTKGHKA